MTNKTTQLIISTVGLVIAVRNFALALADYLLDWLEH